MRKIRKKHPAGGAMAAALIPCLLGCGSEGTSPGLAVTPEAGAIMVELSSLPEGVSCVRALVKGEARSEIRHHDMKPDRSASFTLEGLPTGDVQFGLEAFAQECERLNLDFRLPTWFSDQQSVFLARGIITSLGVVLQPNPIAIWDFDNTMGSLVSDVSGKGNVGEVVQGLSPAAPTVQPTLVQGRKIGSKALDLTGGHTWMRVKSSDSINSTYPAITMAAWVKSSTPAPVMDFEVVISRQEGDGPFALFGLGFFDGRATANVHFHHAISAKPSPRDGSWQHLAATFDGITITLFENGEQTAAVGIGYPLFPLESDITIGAAQSQSQGAQVVRDFFPGVIDEVQLFNAALTAGQIKELASRQP